MSKLSTMQATTAKTLSEWRHLFHNEAGSSALEYVMVLGLATLGITAILGGSANFSYTLVQNLINNVKAVWPA